MDRLIIQGGARLTGETTVSGSKNASLPILMATILNGGKSHLYNVPDVWDVDTSLRLLRTLGAEAKRDFDGSVLIDTEELHVLEAPYDLVKTMRASVLCLGPLLARFNQAKVSLPGGCAIGARPVDQHLKGLEALGAEITLEKGYIKARAPRRLKGARIVFDMPNVGGTENVLMAAVFAEGLTVMQNCAQEPEVADLANALNAMGANISGIGTPEMVIEGVSTLGNIDYTVIPDRIEAGTLIAAIAITGGDAVLTGLRADQIEAQMDKFTAMGIVLDPAGENGLRVRRPGPLQAVRMTTRPYPGFPTDMQAQLMALMTLADGAGSVTETIFENRFMHVAELQRLGADIALDGNTAHITGVDKLEGAKVMATDLRASACLVLAGLAAEGETEVARIYHLDRGYVHLEEKLAALGANIRRISD